VFTGDSRYLAPPVVAIETRVKVTFKAADTPCFTSEKEIALANVAY
jgi:hypothetical protein